MTYNKLKIAIFAIMSSPCVYAITLDPIQIQSAPGELLYAEMNFHQASPDSDLQVSLATPEDLSGLGITHQPPDNLNFFTRRNGQGEGVIVITSSRPILDSELNIVVKVNEGNATRLQHIKTAIKPTTNIQTNEKPLTPQFVTSEKDIALNLPESTQYTQPATNDTAISTEPNQNISVGTTSSTTTEQNTTNAAAAVTASTSQNAAITTDAAQATPKSEPASQDKTKPQPKATAPKKVHQVKKVARTTKQATNTYKTSAASGKYVVQRNESLWSIANNVAIQTRQPVAKVMHDIQMQNQHAFIQGDANRLRKGTALNLAAAPNVQKHKAAQVQTHSKSSTKTSYRLQQAEMSLVAESNQNSTHGSAKKSTQQSQNNAELAVKVMTARKKTVTLQRNVTQLDQALRLKDQRIQILNARLAMLQQQLKTQQQVQKQKH